MSKLNEYAVVYVDDETMALKYFEKGFSQDFKIFTASNAADGWELIQKHQNEVGILMTDQRMPGQTGVELLEKVRHAFPRIIRILVTAYSDVESAVAGVNAGAIYRYISKPWDVAELKITLLRALEFYGVLRERDQLVKEKLSVLHQIILTDRYKNLGVFAAGLSSVYRNSIQAASSFISDMPRQAGLNLLQESNQSNIARTFERSIIEASSYISNLGSRLQQLAGLMQSSQSESANLQSVLQAIKAERGNNGRPLEIKLNSSSSAQANAAQLKYLISKLLDFQEKLAKESVSLSIEAAESLNESGEKIATLVFSDSGADWPKDQQARLFAPFSVGGTGEELGLDLAACYFLSFHFGGKIELGKSAGMRFILTLPMNQSAKASQQGDALLLESLFKQERGWAEFLSAR